MHHIDCVFVDRTCAVAYVNIWTGKRIQHENGPDDLALFPTLSFVFFSVFPWAGHNGPIWRLKNLNSLDAGALHAWAEDVRYTIHE
jgi:hypothetical protein